MRLKAPKGQRLGLIFPLYIFTTSKKIYGEKARGGREFEILGESQ